MKKRRLLVTVCVAVLAVMIGWTQTAYSDIEWSQQNQFTVDSTPLDSVLSADEDLAFVLTPGEILILSMPQGKLINRIPVDKAFDRLTISPKQERLIVTSSTQKIMRIIQLEFVQDIDISGHPFVGAADALVTVAVFSDYQ